MGLEVSDKPVGTRGDRVGEPADPLSRIARGASVFAYSLFLAAPELPAPAIPPEHWQAALRYRQLTPQEQSAREQYFERKASEALAKLPGHR